MDDPPARDIEAAGTRSIAGGQIGVAATGDQATIDARTTTLAAGAIPEPAEVTAPAGTHNLPRRPARIFVGRDNALDRLHSALANDTKAVVTQAVYGLGGVGKSELALHHAHTCRADYALVWWITAEDREQVQAGLAALAARLCPAIALAGTTAQAAGWAVAWLQAHHQWLLVLDNVNDPADVERLLGQLTGGHILLTTRRDTGWDQIADPIWLDVLDPGPAADLLTTRTGHQDADSHNAVAAIAAELGYLPLALDQAAAHITQTRITAPIYLQRLRQHPAVMFAEGGGQAQRTIARLWDITIEAIRARNPDAVELLHILACYAPDGVPRILVGGCSDTGKLDADAALGVLASYSMITLTPDAVSMHRLVQAVILVGRSLDDEDSALGSESELTTALAWLNQAIPAHPDTNMSGWPLLRALIPHAEHLADLFPPSDRPSRLGRVQHELAVFLNAQGQYDQALTLRRSALEIFEATRGPRHRDTASALANLAGTYWHLKRYAEALPLQQRALEIIEAVDGSNHPRTATALNSVAVLYSNLDRNVEALPLQQRALAITEATRGSKHPDVAVRLHNLAYLHTQLGQWAEALPLQQRALAITEATRGPNHPQTARRLHNLAGTYRALGRFAEALPLRQRALTIAEAALGPDHPETILFRDSLAISSADAGPG